MASSLSLDVGYLVVVDSSVCLSVVVQQVVAISVLSQEMNACPSTCHLETEAGFVTRRDCGQDFKNGQDCTESIGLITG